MKTIVLIISFFLLGSLYHTTAQTSLLSTRQTADSLRFIALENIKIGNTQTAQNQLIDAYQLYLGLSVYDMASMCLYERAIEYLNVGNFDALRTQMLSLQDLHRQAQNYQIECSDQHTQVIAYNYHSVASAYYSQVDSIDLATIHGRQSITAMEQIDDLKTYRILPVWNYYNQALYYDLFVEKPIPDSIAKYLSKARASIADMHIPTDSLEALVSVEDLEAWLLYYQQDYFYAEKKMQSVLQRLSILDTLSPNTVITEKGEAYRFMAMLSADQDRFQDAYYWQTKATDNDAQRYDIEKRQVLQEIETRYQVEKKELEMSRLTAINRAHTHLLIAFAILAIALILAVWVLYLRKKNIESQLYEAALEAENIQTSLQHLKAQTDIDPLRILQQDLAALINATKSLPDKETIVQHIINLDLSSISAIIAQSTRLTNMDKRYILCFAAGMTAEQVATLMHLEPASVYTVRYRLRKKFPKDFNFPY